MPAILLAWGARLVGSLSYLGPIGTFLSPFLSPSRAIIGIAIIALLLSQWWLFNQGVKSGKRKTVARINSQIKRNHDRAHKAQSRVGNYSDSDVDKRLRRWARP